MGEIKFRAWNGKEMLYNLVINLDGEDEVAVWLDGTLKGDEPHAWQEEGLLQFIGLKDKEGTNIYEGDIIRHPLCKMLVTIIWRNGCFCILANGNGIESLYDDAPTSAYSWEVLGNIHENPELLTGK